jgi:nitrite reductase/ring-hydroxylating ferredoxin subunit
MWIPVLEAKKLKRDPVRVVYWGSPVVLFRTESGEIGALEDLCAHRGVPLSCGAVQGETLRCGYHHFAFDRKGECTSIPKVFDAKEDFKRACRVTRYFVREALGLIFISVEDEPAAPFPLDAEALAAPRHASQFLECEGHPLAWLDHNADVPHAVCAHVGSLLKHWPGAEPEARMSLAFSSESRHPIRPAFEATFEHSPPRPLPLVVNFLQAQSLLGFCKKLLTRTPREGRFRVDGALLSPACHDLRYGWSGAFGQVTFRTIDFVNPLSPNRVVFVGVFPQSDGRGLLGMLERQIYGRNGVGGHVAHEDAVFLERTRVADGRRFHVTPADGTAVSRALFARYLREKAHLFPADSLIHGIKADPGLEVPCESEPRTSVYLERPDLAPQEI